MRLLLMRNSSISFFTSVVGWRPQAAAYVSNEIPYSKIFYSVRPPILPNESYPHKPPSERCQFLPIP